ncbi:hypothetical protein [Lactobacillus sp. UCMA15818]|uniref:hypothetical protein n=1 Tax=Lactobacillus sp. UCMA15818 TaxID=2583394 RepID=UPI0025B16693|nr:hypothetical protein [Lactobacillus sp. UCMA15818]MDN2452510.1 hypothetical protein [Lactobacillus sp. UCMA15818]
MENIIDLSKIKKLLDSDISAYAISEETGLTRAMINRYRKNESKLENMTIKVALKLQKCYDEKFNMGLIGDSGQNISYDSEELIAELKEDITDFGDFECWAWIKKIDGVKIYTNYDFKDGATQLTKDEVKTAHENGEQFEILKAKHLLELLEKQNEIL